MSGKGWGSSQSGRQGRVRRWSEPGCTLLVEPTGDAADGAGREVRRSKARDFPQGSCPEPDWLPYLGRGMSR